MQNGRWKSSQKTQMINLLRVSFQCRYLHLTCRNTSQGNNETKRSRSPPEFPHSIEDPVFISNPPATSLPPLRHPYSSCSPPITAPSSRPGPAKSRLSSLTCIHDEPLTSMRETIRGVPHGLSESGATPMAGAGTSRVRVSSTVSGRPLRCWLARVRPSCASWLDWERAGKIMAGGDELAGHGLRSADVRA